MWPPHACARVFSIFPAAATYAPSLGFHIEFRWCQQPAYRQLPLVVHCYFIATSGDQMKRKGGSLNPFTLRFNLVLGNLQFQPQFCGWCSSIFPFKIGMFHFHLRCSGGSCPVQVTWRSLWHHLPPAKKTTTRCCEWPWISHQSIPKLLVNWVYHHVSWINIQLQRHLKIMVLQKIEDAWNIRLASQEFTRDGKIPSLMMVMKCRSGKCLNPIPVYMLPCMSVTPYMFINCQQLVETLPKVGKKDLYDIITI